MKKSWQKFGYRFSKMGKGSVLILLLSMLSVGYALERCPKQKTSPGREILCYTTSYDVEKLNHTICRCTSLVHQGHDLKDLSISRLEGLRKSLKQLNPVLQVIISISDTEKSLITSADVRQEAVARVANVLEEVDGVELNVTAGSKEKLLRFVEDLKDELIRKSNDKRIFIALPSKTEELGKQYDLRGLAKYADLFTLATHYVVDQDEVSNTFHPSRLMGIFDTQNTDSLVDLITGLGAPKRKILVSLPASVYQFTLRNVDENAPGSPVVEKFPSVLSQKELCDKILEGEWTIERDEDLTAPYAFKNDSWMAFEDKVSVGIKGKYVLLRDLAGLAIRNVENDLKNDCEEPLTHEIYHSFMDFKRKTRGAVLSSLQDDLQSGQLSYPSHAKSSGFRIVHVVDTEGHIHAVRENTQTEFVCSRQGYFVHPKSCNRFYRCVKFNQGVDDYSVFEFDCPAGLAFDERTEVCVWPGSLPQGSPCPGSSEIPPVPRVRFQCPDHPGYYVDPQNCRWFFACLDMGGSELTPYEFTCPYGLVFDQNKLICEWPWLVPGCEDSGYSKSGHDTRHYGNEGSYKGHDISAGSGGHGSYDYEGHGGGHGHSSGETGHDGGSFGHGGSGHDGGSFGHGGSGRAGGSFGHGGSGHDGGSFGHGGSGHDGGSIDQGGSGHDGGSIGHGGTGPEGGTFAHGGGTIGHGGVGHGYTTGTETVHTTVHSGHTYPQTHTTTGIKTITGHPGLDHTVITGTSNQADHVSVEIGTGIHHGHSVNTGSFEGNAGTPDHVFTTGSGDIHHSNAGSGYTFTDGSTNAGHTYPYTHTTTGTFHGGNHGVATSVGHPGSPSHPDHVSVEIGTGTKHVGIGDTTTGTFHGGSHGITTDIGHPGSSDYPGHVNVEVGTGTKHTGIGHTVETHETVGHGIGITSPGISHHPGTEQTYHPGSSVHTTIVSQGHPGGSVGYPIVTSTQHPFDGHGSNTDSGYHGSEGGRFTTGHVTGTTSHFYGHTDSGSSTYPGHVNVEVGTGTKHTGIGHTVETHGTVGHEHPGGSVGYPVVTSTQHPFDGHGINTDSGYHGSEGGHFTTGHVTGTTSHFYGHTDSGHSKTGQTTIITGHPEGGHSIITHPGTIVHPISHVTEPTSHAYGNDGSEYTKGEQSTIISNSHGNEDGHGIITDSGHFTGTTSHYHGSSESGYSTGGQSTIITGSHVGGGGEHGLVTDSGHFPGTTPQFHGSTEFGHSKGGQTTIITHPQPGVETGHGVITHSGPFVHPISHVTEPTSHAYGNDGSEYTKGGQSTIISHSHGNEGGHGIITDSGHFTGTTSDYHGTSGSGHSKDGQTTIITDSHAGHGTGHEVVTGTGHFTPGYVTKTSQFHGNNGYDYSKGGQTTIITGTSPGIESGHGVITDSGTTQFHGHAGIDFTHTGPTKMSPESNGIGTGHSTSSDVSHPGGGYSPHIGITIQPGKPRTPDFGYVGSDNSVSTGSGYSTNHGVSGTNFDFSGSEHSGSTGSGHSSTGSGHPGYVNVEINSGATKISPGGSGPGYHGVTGIGSHGIHDESSGITIPVAVITDDSYSFNHEVNKESNHGFVSPLPTEAVVGEPDAGEIISQNGRYPGDAVGQGINGGTGKIYGAKTKGSYPGFGTSNVFLQGQAVPGVILNGRPMGDRKDQGLRPGSGTIPGKVGTAIVQNTGYKINEYHDNGGRGTIRYNNGYVTSKLTESDLQDIRAGGVTLSSSIGESGNVGGSGITKTGPTKTGITTAQIGGSGSYVTGRPMFRPRPNPDQIGAHAFDGNVGFTSNAINGNENVNPTELPDTVTSAHPETNRINVQKVTNKGAAGGYKYPKPNVSFNTGVSKEVPIVVTNPVGISTPRPFVLTSTEPAYINVELQNTPKGGSSGSIDGSPAFGYKYPNKPAQIQPSTSARPIVVAENYYTTANPIAFTTDAFESYKTTVFEAAKLPISVSKVKPIYDDGYKTVVSSTPIPVRIDNGGYKETKSRTGRPFVTVTPARYEESFGTSTPKVYTTTSNQGYSYSKPKTPFITGYKTVVPTVKPGVTYKEEPEITTIRFQNRIITTTESPSKFSETFHRNKVNKLISNYDRGTVKFTPDVQQFETLQPVNPAGSGEFNKEFYSTVSTISSTPLYEANKSKGKVIVKLSDLHPLLLGKLGAECTCKADPFATLRGPGKKLISSANKGLVDLSNYDESDIYVDLEKEDNYEDKALAAYVSSTSAPSGLAVAGASGSGTSRFRSGKSLKKDDEAYDDDDEESVQEVSECARAGLFRHPNFCNKFYACHYDEWKKKFTLHVFNCPIHLSFDSSAGACNWPSKGPACQDNNLLV